MQMTRRSFVGATAAMGALGAGLLGNGFAALADEAAKTPEEEALEQAQALTEDQAEAPTWTPRDPYPGETAKNPNVVPIVTVPAPDVLTPEQVEDYINNEITVTEDYVKADGTVIPAAFVNMRNKVNRNGIGIGSYVTTDDQFDVWAYLMTEEEAAQYAEAPQLVDFTATDYAHKTGRTVEESQQILENLAEKALLHRVRRAGVPFYHTQTQEYGIYEALIKTPLFNKEYMDLKDAGAGADLGLSFLDSGTSMYRTYPVDLSVVRGEYTEFDDWHAILDRNEVFSVSPCMCRTKVALQAEVDALPCADQHPIETCICTGEHAQYIIEIGAGRQISREECEAIMQDAVDRGMILESVFTRSAENICCCHADCCQNVGAVRLLNGGPAIEQYSSFYLQHDVDDCIKCGACRDKCPMFSITMDEETGYPIVDNACVRCGQCALACPVGARGLVLKPEEDRAYLPHDLVEDYGVKARARAAKGYLFDYPGQTAWAEAMANAQ